MRNNVWIALLKRIPLQYHGALVVVTAVGVEISVQSILRMEEDYLAIRGRLAGTTETGRVYFVPYDQLNYVGYNREVNEELFAEMYGEPPMFAAVPKPPIEEPPTPPPVAETPAVAPENEPIPMETSPSGMRKIPSKKALLERLKARNRQLGGGGSPPGAPPTSSS